MSLRGTGALKIDMINRPKAEYGGFLPLELNDGQEHFIKYKDFLRRYNSIKAALYYLIETLPVRRIYIPYYYCPTTTDAIKCTGIDVSFYHINDDLLPEELPDESGSAVLLVNYFGVRSGELRKLTDNFRNSVVIADNAHSFFSEPVMRDGIYQVYSAKKFFGVPDGAYLVGSSVAPAGETTGYSHNYAGFLLTSYEAGTNAAYSMKKAADKVIADSPGNMSSLALGLLRNVDYGRTFRRREDNFSILHQRVGNYNELSLPDRCAAYLYPFLLAGRGRELKRYLIQNRIYVPTLWSGDDLLKNGNDFELSMSDDAVFLPVDQRYDSDDMNYIAESLISFLRRS